MFWIAYYTPWLMYWWMTQKWFPNLDIEDVLSNSDLGITKRFMERLDKVLIFFAMDTHSYFKNEYV